MELFRNKQAYRVLVGIPVGKRSLRRPRRRWDDNIKTDLREVGYDAGDWTDLARELAGNDGNEPPYSLKVN